MSVPPFRRLRTFPIWLMIIGGYTVLAFLAWQPAPLTHSAAPPVQAAPYQAIRVIDGDTVKLDGNTYRLAGFNTPENGDLARCEDERKRADAATKRLKALVAAGDARLSRVACSCKPGLEGTKLCNFGRLCGTLAVGGRDVAQIMISERLAEPYVCSATSCPKRRSWCG